MGIIKAMRGDDGRPYISLEDIIREIDIAKNYYKNNKDLIDKNTDFLDNITDILKNLEVEYYKGFLLNKK